MTKSKQFAGEESEQKSVLAGLKANFLIDQWLCA